ncbi:AAA-like domain-containing protein [Clostridium ljungdahlii]|uniref:Putative AAA-ATPase n=1 Tax=Clostridium ljungdahlii TaxID=1538 RepID=A0A170NBG2_9CLOT|nr:AAA-like domain-containing protein [Clostridium ljungdahlii]OAA83193.1 putative AAA-ATPase [Clostridium ljungdahlii]
MKKRFNVTGTCIPEKHYMVDISDKIKKIMDLIENEEYFVINRPRQYGKTTTLYMLERVLSKNAEYLVISISFEGVGDLIFEKEQSFVKAFLEIIADSLYLRHENLASFLGEEKKNVENFKDLSMAITKFIIKVNKKVILMIDEVDKSSNNQLFLSFLGMLRNKYLLRNAGKDKTFHSVILAGVHDVKSLKLKIRPDEEHKYNSPWNIASDFDVDMSFSREEIGTMLDEYAKYKGVKLDKGYFSDKFYFYTSGYPFLVSKLCKIIDEKIMPEGSLKWEKEYMDMAVKKILGESNTNFDSLIKNIENNSKLKEMVKNLIIDGNKINYNISNPIINMGMLYGIFKNEDNNLEINNRIYEQLIYDYMSSLIETSTDVGFYNEKSNFIKADGNLDVKEILLKFQQFIKHEYSEKRKSFLEADGRLLFLAFISPIINGTGFAFKEVRGGEEKRFDIVITYNKRMYILELKIWRGEEYHKKGLLQLGEYLEQYGLNEGYLLVFDFRKSKSEMRKVDEVNVNVENKVKKIVEAYC